MVDKEIGRLAKLPLREIWKLEDRDFTPWLRDHIDQLADELGMTLEVQGTEVPMGRYKLDLLAINPETGRNVVIENQLERADHAHMGQLVTYAAGAADPLAGSTGVCFEPSGPVWGSPYLIGGCDPDSIPKVERHH